MVMEQRATEMQEFLMELLRQMVRQPDEVRILMSRADAYVVLTVDTAPEDVGRVIGQSGRTAKSLRCIAAAVAAKKGISLQLVLPEFQRREGRR